MALSERGYGTRHDIENMAIDKFILTIHYQNYLEKYRQALHELNTKEK